VVEVDFTKEYPKLGLLGWFHEEVIYSLKEAIYIYEFVITISFDF
jgi:hypothetical protein